MLDNFFETDVGAHDAAGQPHQEDEDVLDGPYKKKNYSSERIDSC